MIEMDKIELRNYLAIGLISAVAILGKLIPHLPNFSPMQSMALLGGAYITRKYLAYILPIVLIYATDFILNNTIYRTYYPDHEGLVFFSDYMLVVLPSILLIVALGQFFLKRFKTEKLILTALAGSVLFFLITNLGAWISPTSIYSKNIAGLLQSYIAGIPFFRASVLSTLLFTLLSFGGIEVLANYLSKRSQLVEG
jgi:hypothetical protein